MRFADIIGKLILGLPRNENEFCPVLTTEPHATTIAQTILEASPEPYECLSEDAPFLGHRPPEHQTGRALARVKWRHRANHVSFLKF